MVRLSPAEKILAFRDGKDTGRIKVTIADIQHRVPRRWAVFPEALPRHSAPRPRHHLHCAADLPELRVFK
jgi:hypothetical protein